jgi:hypothetical protein
MVDETTGMSALHLTATGCRTVAADTPVQEETFD